MNNRPIIFFLLCSFLFIYVPSTNAQNQITGRVTAFNSYGLNFVKVSSKKAKQIVLTDTLGRFSIDFKEKDLLRFQAEGFNPYQIKPGAGDNLKINLIYQNTNKAREQVLESRHMTEKDLDYACGHLSGENNNYSNYQNIFELIQSVYPQASINKSGSPVKVILGSRGPNSAFSGDEALLVVDKVIMDDISSIVPSQVSKISVLIGNDAGYYGVRGGNGVIEIELKH